MGLDKLTHKPVLKATRPEVLLPEAQSVISEAEKTETYIPEATDTQDLIKEYVQEIEEWVTFQNRMLPYLDSLGVKLDPATSESLGIETLTHMDLRKFLELEDPGYAEALDSWDTAHWDSGVYQGVLYSVSDRVLHELMISAERLSSSLLSAGESADFMGLPLRVRNAERNRLDLSQGLRVSAVNLDRNARKKIDDCFIRKLVRGLINTSTASHILNTDIVVTLGQKIEQIRRQATGLRQLLRYAKLVKKVDWDKTKKNITNRVMQMATQTVLGQISFLYTKLESAIVSPVSDFFTGLSELSDTELCGAFDDNLALMINEVTKLRDRAAHSVIEWEQSIESRYKVSENMLSILGEKLELDKQSQIIDHLLQSLETLLGNSDIEQWIIDYIHSKTKVSKLTALPTAGVQYSTIDGQVVNTTSGRRPTI